jgi:ceramide glucosyltransferase
LAIGSAIYWLVALVLIGTFTSRRPASVRFHAPVSVLKPLCGVDDNLYENLRSFCDQEYPSYQVLFGVRRSDDPAVPVVRRLIKEFPERDLSLVVSDLCLGTNPKVSLLATLSRRARYDTLVIADSDIRVGREYLNVVVSPLADRRVGLVTCLYKGMPTRGVWSVLGAMFINEWFFPSAVVATTFGRVAYAFGATIACQRRTLTGIGGFESLAHDLADDYVLGARVARQGLSVVLSPYVVETVVADRRLTALWDHELRWARTLRTVDPSATCCRR